MDGYSITIFKGNHTNVNNGYIKKFEKFDELASGFSECMEGGKHEVYFVRGALKPIYRRDSNLKYSNLIVIDADSGLDGNASPPFEAYQVLKSNNLNHCIYTTHSHNKEQNKYRIIIPCNGFYQKENLQINVRGVMSVLKSGNVDIKYVKEMGVWSQPWFMPTRDDPNDGLFEFYQYTRGDDWCIILDDTADIHKFAKNIKKDASKSDEISTLDELYENIRTGEEYHESMLNISYQLIKDGMSEAHVKSHLKTLMNNSQESGSERWIQRYDEIDRCVDGAIKRINEEYNVYVPKNKKSKKDDESTKKSNSRDIKNKIVQENTVMDIQSPPGLLGDLYKQAYDCALYQYKEVALVSALGVVAGICGRKFNMMDPKPMGLNLYMTLIADTGVGKEGIGDFAELCLRSGATGLKEYNTFCGPSSFTSAKAIYNSFKDNRSLLCVASEAGLLLSSKSGNVEARTAMILDMYSKSARNQYTKAASFSGTDDSIPSVRAVALTMISESTEKVLFDAYRQDNSLENGYIPRQMMIKVAKNHRKMNRSVQNQNIMNEKLKEQLGYLMDICSRVQNCADPNPVSIRFINKNLFDKAMEFGDLLDAIRSNTALDYLKNNFDMKIDELIKERNDSKKSPKGVEEKHEYDRFIKNSIIKLSDDEYLAYGMYLNSHVLANKIVQIVVTRSFVKALKISALACLFDSAGLVGAQNNYEYQQEYSKANNDGDNNIGESDNNEIIRRGKYQEKCDVKFYNNSFYLDDDGNELMKSEESDEDEYGNTIKSTIFVTSEFWEFGRNLVVYEINNIARSFRNFSSDFRDEFYYKVVRVIDGILDNEFKNKNVLKIITDKHINNGIIPISAIKQIIKHTSEYKEVRRLNKFSNRHPLDDVLKEMKEMGYIQILDKDPISLKKYSTIRVLDDFGDINQYIVDNYGIGD